MSARFKTVDRKTPMLLPPDLRDWVAEDDLVHFVLEAVDRLPLSHFKFNQRGTGDRQFPPHMMFALLIYSYANGIFSSRKIERATYRDLAVRYLTATTTRITTPSANFAVRILWPYRRRLSMCWN